MTVSEKPLDLVVLSELRRATRSGAARRVRELAGISQSELARVLGVTPASVSLYESGLRVPSERVARPYVEALCRWAESLRASEDGAVLELLGTAELLDAIQGGASRSP
jgi:transcriptional regulator with XRE-family HTH domain